MGKGDKKTRRGKIYRSSYGKVRPHAVKSSEAASGGAGSTLRKVVRRHK